MMYICTSTRVQVDITSGYLETFFGASNQVCASNLACRFFAFAQKSSDLSLAVCTDYLPFAEQLARCFMPTP